MLVFGDYFFLFFHTALIVFNLFAWLYKPLRKANLVTLLLTAASWFILGIFYGIGYCPLTDWHWDILYSLGQTDIPNSYVQYLIDRWLGISIMPKTADYLTLGCFIVALTASIFVNLRDFRNRKMKRAKNLQ
jgi:hypothetical protein